MKDMAKGLKDSLVKLGKPISSTKLIDGLSGVCLIPGDKSISHRALMLATLACGESRINGLLESADVLAVLRACRALGAKIKKCEDGSWKVVGVGLGALKEPKMPLDLANSGTGVRLLMGMVAGAPIEVSFCGDESLSSRPMGRVLNPLQRMGMLIVKESNEGYLPITVRGRAETIPIIFDQEVASAQVKSAILFAGLSTNGRVQVREKVKSRDHTELLLKYLGAPINISSDNGDYLVEMTGVKLIQGCNIEIPGDPSSAAFLAAAAAIVPGSSILLENVMINPTRAAFFDVIAKMGAKVKLVKQFYVGAERCADIEVSYDKLNGVEVTSEIAPWLIDEFPILGVVAAFAKGTSVMRGLSELRVKESDRLFKIKQGLENCGIEATIDNDDLIVKGGLVRGGATIDSDGDHRIAMSFLVLGLASKEPVNVENTECIATSFPQFVDCINQLGGRLVSTTVNMEIS